MSERERWIVYPLLFLALGAALRDKLAKQTRTKQLVCEQLFVVDAEGRPMAELRGSNLRLDFGGPDQGYVIANVVHAKSALYQRGQQITAQTTGNSMGVSWPQLLQLLQKMGLLQVTPKAGPPPGQDPPPTDEVLPGGAASIAPGSAGGQSSHQGLACPAIEASPHGNPPAEPGANT